MRAMGVNRRRCTSIADAAVNIVMRSTERRWAKLPLLQK
jgi:hypothetical protein